MMAESRKEGSRAESNLSLGTKGRGKGSVQLCVGLGISPSVDLFTTDSHSP